jgi:hypothetical protein
MQLRFNVVREHRALTVTWKVLAHNLWVLARLPQAEPAEVRQLAA